MKQKDILTVFHYITLHSAPAGVKYGRFHGEDEYTTKESERLVRLPMYYSLSLEEVDYISEAVKEFFPSRPQQSRLRQPATAVCDPRFSLNP